MQRTFWAAFFAVLLIFLTACGILFVDYTSGQSGSGSYFFDGDRSPNDEPDPVIRRGIAAVRDYGILFLPRSVRLIARWGEAVAERYFTEKPQEKQEYANALRV